MTHTEFYKKPHPACPSGVECNASRSSTVQTCCSGSGLHVMTVIPITLTQISCMWLCRRSLTCMHVWQKVDPKKTTIKKCFLLFDLLLVKLSMQKKKTCFAVSSLLVTPQHVKVEWLCRQAGSKHQHSSRLRGGFHYNLYFMSSGAAFSSWMTQCGWASCCIPV